MKITSLSVLSGLVMSQGYSSSPVGTVFTDLLFKSLMECQEWINEAMNCNPPKSKISNYEFRFLKVTKDVAWHLMGVKRCTPPTVMPTSAGGGNRYRRHGGGFDFEQIDEEFSLNFEHDFQAFIVGYLSENRPLEGTRLKSAGEGSGDFEGGSVGIARSNALGQAPSAEMEEFNYEDAKGKSSGNEKKLNVLAKRCKLNMDKMFDRKEITYCPKLGSWKRRMNGLIRTVGIMQNVCLRKAEEAAYVIDEIVPPLSAILDNIIQN